jgi:hypothetical protein
MNEADDDGFCEHFSVMRMTESKPDDLRVLQARGFIHIFDDRVLIIRDWKENNYIRSDRYSPSKYLETYKKEIKLLSEGSGCIQSVSKVDTSGIPKVDQRLPQVRLGKDRLGKDISKDISFPKENKENPIKDIIPFYISLVKERTSIDLEVSWGAVGKRIKHLLTRKTNSWTLEGIKEFLVWFVDTDKAKDNGYAMTTALSDHSLNQYKLSKNLNPDLYV